MANKKITDLQARSSVTDELNFPSDDTIQSYRVTAAQMFAYLRAKLPPDVAEIGGLTIVPSVASSALTIALKTIAGNNPSTTDRIRVAFRSATLASGVFNTREIIAATSITISSGSTLGQVSGQAARIWIYLIDNSGTPELAVSHAYYPENSLVSTTAEGGAGAADSASAIYSTVARTNVPLRVIGYIDNTQTTAGTWASVGSQTQLLPLPSKKAPTVTKLSSGSGTYYVPAGCTRIIIRMVGGGGGGGGAGASGHGGATAGGGSTFGTSLLTANAGGAQPVGINVAGGTFVVNAPAVDIGSIAGGAGGGGGLTNVAGIYMPGGMGGVSFFGGAGSGGPPNGNGIGAQTNSGSGGGGGGGNSAAGNYSGSGGGAGAFIQALISNPDASYAYAVGAAGGAGGTGGGGAGSAGGSGLILVEEFYE